MTLTILRYTSSYFTSPSSYILENVKNKSSERYHLDLVCLHWDRLIFYDYIPCTPKIQYSSAQRCNRVLEGKKSPIYGPKNRSQFFQARFEQFFFFFSYKRKSDHPREGRFGARVGLFFPHVLRSITPLSTTVLEKIKRKCPSVRFNEQVELVCRHQFVTGMHSSEKLYRRVARFRT